MKEDKTQEIEIYKNLAQKIRDNAVKIAFNKKTHPEKNSGWSFKELIQYGDMDFKKYIETLDAITQLKHNNNTDAKAYWVDQQEVAFLKKDEINNGYKLGTDNIRQCVAVAIKGRDIEGKELAALAHVDRFTKSDSLIHVLDKFQKEGAQIFLYGGIDQSYQKNISNSNIELIVEAIKKSGHHDINIKNKLIGDPKLSSEFVFDPLNIEIKQEMFANKGYETKSIRIMKRDLNGKIKNNNYYSNDIVRNSDLCIINPQECNNLNNFNENHLNKEEINLCLNNYATNYDSYLDNLDYARTQYIDSFPETASKMKRNMEAVHYLLNKQNNSVSLEDIYNKKIFTQEKIQEIQDKKKLEFPKEDLNKLEEIQKSLKEFSDTNDIIYYPIKKGNDPLSKPFKK